MTNVSFEVGMYGIIRVAKPADRPRAIHKLNLQPGDVVRLVKWQDDKGWWIGKDFIVQPDGLTADHKSIVAGIPSIYPKGLRPLFTVISRAADARPDETLTL